MACEHSFKDPVVNSRKRPGYVLRRRECPKCGDRYNTVEMVVTGMRHTETPIETLERQLLKKKLLKIAGRL